MVYPFYSTRNDLVTLGYELVSSPLEGSSPSPFAAQLPLQTINLQLHGSSIFLMRDMTPNSRVALTSMGGMHINLPVPSLLKIEEMILMLGPHGFLSVWT